MSPSWPEFQANHPFLILDGAMGTELEQAGVPVAGHPLWSALALLEWPEAIRNIHSAYAQAGADILTTSTYQASLQSFKNAGLGKEKAAECLVSGVTLAAQAIESHLASGGSQTPLIAASLGPYGAYLADRSEYTGNYGMERVALYDFHAPQVEILASSPADILACETIPSLAEGEVLVELLSVIPDKPAWISFTSRDGLHTSHGEQIRDCVELCAEHSHIRTGINCIQPRLVTSLLQAGRVGNQGLQVVYPNGEPNRITTSDGTLNSQWFSKLAPQWLESEVQILGGCCGTSPAFTRLLVQLRESLIT